MKKLFTIFIVLFSISSYANITDTFNFSTIQIYSDSNFKFMDNVKGKFYVDLKDSNVTIIIDSSFRDYYLEPLSLVLYTENYKNYYYFKAYRNFQEFEFLICDNYIIITTINNLQIKYSNDKVFKN